MKQCTACGEFKPEDQYSWRNKLLGKRSGTCKECQNKRTKDWYQRNKEAHKAAAYVRKIDKKEQAQQFVWEYLSTHPCVDCGESDPVVLEFDHVRGKKKSTISRMIIGGYGIEALKKEIAKTEVRCANCHRRKTAREQSWKILDQEH